MGRKKELFKNQEQLANAPERRKYIRTKPRRKTIRKTKPKKFTHLPFDEKKNEILLRKKGYAQHDELVKDYLINKDNPDYDLSVIRRAMKKIYFKAPDGTEKGYLITRKKVVTNKIKEYEKTLPKYFKLLEKVKTKGKPTTYQKKKLKIYSTKIKRLRRYEDEIAAQDSKKKWAMTVLSAGRKLKEQHNPYHEVKSTRRL